MINRLIRFGTPDRISLKRSSEYNPLRFVQILQVGFKRTSFSLPKFPGQSTFCLSRPLTEKVNQARDVNQAERRRRTAPLVPGSLANKLIHLPTQVGLLFTSTNFRNPLQIRFTGLNIFVRQAPPAVVASRAGECKKFAMARRAR